MTAYRFCSALVALVALGASEAQRAPSQNTTYTNPVVPDDFPDPFILRAGKAYYAYATNSAGMDVPTMRSTDLVSWEFVGNALGPLPSWASGGFTWAPEVMAVKNGYVLYYTARHTESGRQCIGAARASRPEGPFVDRSGKPLVCQLKLGGSIDASPFVDKDGTRYLYWKNDGNCCGQRTGLWVQKLSADGMKLLGKPKDLIYNGALWEGNLIEAPTLWRQGSKYYLFFSASAFDSDTYAVGYAVGNSPLGPFKKAAQNPILASRGKVAGPGGQGIVLDGAGKPWFYYHAWEAGNVGYNAGGRRSMYIDRLEFKGGVPRVRSTTSAQPAPVPLGK
nr:glycoside hydrolase family 43 protein [Deinobacterium chartae]